MAAGSSIYPVPITIYGCRPTPDTLHIDLFFGNDPHGMLNAALLMGRPIQECIEDLDKLLVRHPEIGGTPPMFHVQGSSMGQRFHNLGLGTSMYAIAAKMVWESHKAVLIPSWYAEGGTSRDARRVWQGKRFGELVDREGFVVVWKIRERP